MVLTKYRVYVRLADIMYTVCDYSRYYDHNITMIKLIYLLWDILNKFDL